MRFLVVITAFVFSDSLGQGASEQPISLEILYGSSPLKDCQVALTLKFKNVTDKNFLLYGFESEFNRHTDVARICNFERTGGGFALFIYDESGNMQYADWSIPDSIDYKPMPKERLDAIMRMERLKYLHETRVINRNDIIQFERKIDLRDYHLKKGKYYLQIGYYSGKGVGQVMVGNSQIETDKKANNAELYQGCSISNKITIEV